MDYDLEIPRIVKEISKSKAKKVLLQLPDGLKPKATELVKILEQKTKAKIYVWAGSNFGACDVAQVKGFDLVVNFGHASI